MAKRKRQFKPDRHGTGILNKLYIPHSQRLQILKWSLYSLLFLAVLVIQDSVLSRYRVFGGMFDLAPAVIILIAVIQGSYSGSVFALVTSMIYVFAGTGPGYYAFFFLCLYTCLAAVFREEFLRRSRSASWLCSAVAVVLYEMTIFGIGVMYGVTYLERIDVFVITSLIGILVMPVLFPVIERIGKIGGETWKE